jgi:hypothetical protein
MMIDLDASAPVLDDDCELLNGTDVAGILVGAFEICESIQDNDIERWSLTKAGQFVRECGQDGGRFYVWPENEALDFLDGMVVDEVMNAVRAALAGRRSASAIP